MKDHRRGSSVVGLSGWLLGAALALLALGFAAAALGRRLNFDEALALRAGWLLVQEIPAAPPFAMPMTWLLGLLGSAIEDPGTVLLLARLAVLAALVPATAWALTAARRPATAALAAVLTLSQATFVVHAPEFRYDAALLVGWLVAYRLLLDGRPRSHLHLGAVAGWLAAHHLKGLYFALCLLLVAALAALARRGGRGRRLAHLLAGLAAALGLWIGLAALLGLGDELAAVYRTFFGLAAGASERLAPWESLAGTLRRDTVWWLGALLAVVATVWRLAAGGARRLLERRDSWTLAFALLPLGFLFLHPHPWAYMLTLPAPFLALLMAERLAEAAARPSPRWVAAALAVVLVLQWAATRATPWQVYLDALAAPRGPQVETLRLLRARALPGDRIFDPSGMAYFVDPCIGEWYLDTLFREPARRGLWMSELERVDLASCNWLLNTYRVRMLPERLERRLAGSFVLLEGGGGLALHHEDPRLAGEPPGPGLAHRELTSFW